MAFTEETDFDGGQWVNGEFFGAAKKRKVCHARMQRLFVVTSLTVLFDIRLPPLDVNVAHDT